MASDDDWTKPQAMAIPKEGYFTLVEAGATLSADAVSKDAGRAPATVEKLEAELRRCTKRGFWKE